jgi:hypothetical protein
MASVIVRRLVVALALAAFLPVGTIAAEGVLEIYFIDTEGGQATLLVSPTGGTLLIDTGFAGLDTANPDKESGRDAARMDGNPPDEFSANLQDTDDTNHAAHYLKLSARDDGSFSVFNSRTKMTKTYGARHTTEAR